MTAEELGPKTRFVGQQIRLVRPRLVILSGPKKGEEVALEGPGRLLVGSDDSCQIKLPGLLPVHAELSVLVEGGIRVRDSSNGKLRLNGARIVEAILEPGGTLDLDGTEVRLQDATDTLTVLPSDKDFFGPARGRSLVMREIFGVLEAIAPTNATLLLLGETGTGKDVLARGAHQASPRKDQPLLTLDCGAIAPTLIEAELFGYERGAFTGAEEQRLGAFETAEKGTLFLDEIGELPLDVQPKLLRAIDDREIHRVGGSRSIPVDVRIIAATKRDLLDEVKRGRFREDLYFRLAVVPLTLPPLRERRDDIPALVEHFRTAFAERTGKDAEIDFHEIQALMAHDWPGNVRELKNTVERALWLAQTGDGRARFLLPTADSIFQSHAEAEAEAKGPTFDAAETFSNHKSHWEEECEKKFLAWLLARADGSISKAARLASMDRKHLRGLLRKHGLIGEKADEES